MKLVAAVAGGIALVAIAGVVASPASGIPNQDNSTLCSIPAYSKSKSHYSDCVTTGTTIGDVGHDTSAGLAQTFYPLAVPTMTSVAPPTPQNLCAAPSTKPC